MGAKEVPGAWYSHAGRLTDLFGVDKPQVEEAGQKRKRNSGSAAGLLFVILFVVLFLGAAATMAYVAGGGGGGGGAAPARRPATRPQRVAYESPSAPRYESSESRYRAGHTEL